MKSKKPVGWGDFVTQKFNPCPIDGNRMIALVYNWWSLFLRLAEPNGYLAAIVSRPFLLYSIGKQPSDAGQKALTIMSIHGKASYIQKTYQRIIDFFNQLKVTVPHLSPIHC